MATQVSLLSGAVASAGTLKLQSNGTTDAITIGTDQSVTTANTINGLTVGKGAGSVSTNTAVGASALASNSSGTNITVLGYQAGYSDTASYLTAVGYQAAYTNTTGELTVLGNQAAYTNTTGNLVGIGPGALYFNTTGSYNTAVGGRDAASYAVMRGNTTGSYNTAMGHGSLANNTTASNNTAVGYQAGYSVSTDGGQTMLGYQAGYSTTGVANTFVGNSAGYYVSTGTKNTILGRYNGNNGGLDIRTLSNYIVLSDGDGNPRGYWDSTGKLILGLSSGSGGGLAVYSNVSSSNPLFFSQGSGNINGVATGANAAACLVVFNKDSGSLRSINAAGTINASGADYAEYMTKAGDFTVAKGDVVGINAEGKLTNVFADAVSFVVKSTDPSYVGNDKWGVGLEGDELESARQTVDRIAFAGQVPVNVTGATAGQYIVPVSDNGEIKGEAVSNPTFEQYQQVVGKVIAIEQDGRARIIVKVA